MGWGDLDYKKWWSNETYTFSHHILYPKYSISGIFYAFIQGNKSSIMAFLISKGVNIYWRKLKKKLKKDIEMPSLSPAYELKEISLEETQKFEKINSARKYLPVTNEIINHFLYSTQEHSKDVTLHYVAPKNLYILKGRKSARAIVFNPNNQ